MIWRSKYRADQLNIGLADLAHVARKLSEATVCAGRLRAVAVLATVMVASIACAPVLTAPLEHAGPADSSNESTSTQPVNTGAITVPDEIAGFDSDEMERRLGRLLGERNSDGSLPLAAQEVEPASTANEPTLQEILDLLNTDVGSGRKGEVVISVSSAMVSSLANPVLTIKTPPQHGTATVISPTQVLYSPDPADDGGDSFEYELFDGPKSVVSLVVEFVQ